MINDREFEDFVFLQALENAVNFGGKANPKAMLGKVIPKFPEMKDDMAHYMNDIENIVKQVNGMDEKDQRRKLSALKPEALEKKEKKPLRNKYELPELKNVNGKVRVRTEPAPSGRLHMGHIFNIIFNSEYKKKYGGEFLVRFGDTNPDNIDIKNYEAILDDIKWLTGDNVDEVYYQSDRLSTYYKYLRELLERGFAYVCTCDSDVFKVFNDSSESCPHRNLDSTEQIERYENMFNGHYKDGEVAIRFKGDIENKNPALRDFPLARINSNPHARVGTKYKVWPMLNLCVSIDDFDMKLTHVIRGKDHEINMERQLMVHKALGVKSPEYYHLGRMKFEDLILSKTLLSEKVESGEYDGWDDPRVPTVASYRRRGYKAEAFRNMVLAGGISKRDSRITDEEFHKALNFYNKQILEKEADRFSFVVNPKEVEITNINLYPDKEIVLPKHPDFKERGFRKIPIKNKYFIDGIDFENINKGDFIRLMHFANFKVLDKKEDKLELEFVSKDYDKNLKLARNIQFVPREHGEHKHIEIIMQNNQPLKGITEDIDNPKPDTAMQFERFGFVKYDHTKEEGIKVFYFTHR